MGKIRLRVALRHHGATVLECYWHHLWRTRHFLLRSLPLICINSTRSTSNRQNPELIAAAATFYHNFGGASGVRLRSSALSSSPSNTYRKETQCSSFLLRGWVEAEAAEGGGAAVVRQLPRFDVVLFAPKPACLRSTRLMPVTQTRLPLNGCLCPMRLIGAGNRDPPLLHQTPRMRGMRQVPIMSQEAELTHAASQAMALMITRTTMAATARPQRRLVHLPQCAALNWESRSLCGTWGSATPRSAQVCARCHDECRCIACIGQCVVRTLASLLFSPMDTRDRVLARVPPRRKYSLGLCRTCCSCCCCFLPLLLL